MARVLIMTSREGAVATSGIQQSNPPICFIFLIINGRAIIDHEAPCEERFVAVGK
jgi:hypothetical protein